ncbi:hypothetical protein GCM10009860_11180 [Microbacterium mitrae]
MPRNLASMPEGWVARGLGRVHRAANGNGTPPPPAQWFRPQWFRSCPRANGAPPPQPAQWFRPLRGSAPALRHVGDVAARHPKRRGSASFVTEVPTNDKRNH